MAKKMGFTVDGVRIEVSHARVILDDRTEYGANHPRLVVFYEATKDGKAVDYLCGVHDFQVCIRFQRERLDVRNPYGGTGYEAPLNRTLQTFGRAESYWDTTVPWSGCHASSIAVSSETERIDVTGWREWGPNMADKIALGLVKAIRKTIESRNIRYKYKKCQGQQVREALEISGVPVEFRYGHSYDGKDDPHITEIRDRHAASKYLTAHEDEFTAADVD